jgi:phosphate/sulfate permease
VGPLATIYHVYSTSQAITDNATPIPLWVLVFGGICIDLGLVMYGYNVMRSLGNKITYHSPSRGFCMEFGTTLTVLTASKLGVPVSTTHCITGATAAVGLCNDGDNGSFRERAKALNWKLLGWCFFSWIITLPMAGTVAGLIFSFAVHAPKLVR